MLGKRLQFKKLWPVYKNNLEPKEEHMAQIILQAWPIRKMKMDNKQLMMKNIIDLKYSQ